MIPVRALTGGLLTVQFNTGLGRDCGRGCGIGGCKGEGCVCLLGMWNVWRCAECEEGGREVSWRRALRLRVCDKRGRRRLCSHAMPRARPKIRAPGTRNFLKPARQPAVARLSAARPLQVDTDALAMRWPY
ncbi:hypothetical protein EDC01DRAFT_252290 [Geopyxis carbonaria]|nr:hypothetical protein EDC01DRAFT_252290 [Geopyxis carbonaria]